MLWMEFMGNFYETYSCKSFYDQSFHVPFCGRGADARCGANSPDTERDQKQLGCGTRMGGAGLGLFYPSSDLAMWVKENSIQYQFCGGEHGLAIYSL